MREHNRRLKAIEATADEQAPEMPFLILGQDINDPNLYHAEGGKEYRAAQLPELDKHYRLVIIRHDRKPEL